MNWLKNNIPLVFWILHLVGIVGFAILPDYFALITPYHLIIITILLLGKGVNKWSLKLVLTFLALWGIGFFAEYLGVNHQLLFGEYYYTTALGWSIFGVPITIGLNWMSLVYCAYSIFDFKKLPSIVQALLAGVFITGFDYILEPVAIKYNWWQWANEIPPLSNYITWFVLVLIMIFILKTLKTKTLPKNLALNFLLVQTAFFIVMQWL
jgi:putative membrane protein